MINVDHSKFNELNFKLLIQEIRNTKYRYDSDLSDESTYFKGSRYKDDERIARMILGFIYEECGYDALIANIKFVSMNLFEIETYIKKAVLESASCDYYYSFEKEY